MSKTERRCAYCARIYTVEPYHDSEGLARHCSHGCRLGDELPVSRSGVSTISIDALDSSDRTKYMAVPAEDKAPPEMFCHVRQVVKTLMVLDTRTREIALRRLNGESYADISRAVSLSLRRKIGVAAVHIALVRATEKNPWLSVLFEGMVKKQQKRKGKP